MDRCALFVDAGYVLADGAMAVHGTRHRESVSWNYAGLLQFLGSVARDRTGLPLLRCYWYEATVEGRRSSEHDALADLPGVKLRLGRMRPGRREGVESEIHRDLATLARNGALQDAVVVSAEEDLAQVIADVQDLGLRVTLMHITVDGNWTISRALRQECDEIVEVGEAHLRPYVELVMGAEPVRDDERHAVAPQQGRALTNGHGPVGPLGHQQALPAGSPAVPPEIYTAPVIAEYQRTAQPAANGQPGQPGLPQPVAQDGSVGIAQPGPPPAQPGPPAAQAIQPQAQPDQAQGQPRAAQARQPRQPRNPRSRRQPQADAAAPAADIQQGAVAAPSMPPPGAAAQQTVPAAPAPQQAMPPAQHRAPAAQQTAPPQAMPAPQQAATAAQQGMPAQQVAPTQQQAMPPAQQAAPQAMPPAQQAAAAPQQAMPPAHQTAPPPQQAMPPAQQVMPPAQQVMPPAQQAMPPAQQAMPAAQPAPGQALAAQNPGPMQMPPGAPQPGAAPGMAGQPGPQPQAQMPQPMPAPPAQPGLQHPGPPAVPAGLPPAPQSGQPAPPGPMGQPAVPGQPGMPQPPAQPGMAPHQAGPAGPPAGPGAQGMPAGQPVYPAPPAYQEPGPDAQAGPGPHGQAGPRQAMAGPQPSPPLASLPGPMPGQAPSEHALPPGAGDQAPLPAQQAPGSVRAQQAAAPAGRFARGPQDQRAAQQYPAPPADQPGGGVGPAYMPQQQDPYGGLQPAGYPPVPQQTSVSLADAVQAAHGEGFNFGQSVAREAPALWLEAVLARKPRMPSDLEARLLQDSALPIDSLLHDEVRHALRRGFWDALERARH